MIFKIIIIVIIIRHATVAGRKKIQKKKDKSTGLFNIITFLLQSKWTNE